MNYVDVERMERGPFGQVAEQVFFDRVPGYTDEFKARVRARLSKDVQVEPVVGISYEIRIIHDGEVGPSIGAVPRVPKAHDPLTHGV